MSSSNDQVQITCFEIIREENGKPVIGPNPYDTKLKMDEKFQVLFENWYKHTNPSAPLNNFEFLYWPHGLGHGNQCQRLQENQTPEDVHMRERAKIYAKRKDLDCDVNTEPSTSLMA
ncbi:hypothetical protein CI109_102978 [Kwoniella shandongensis]|uniref:Uncharacterized protein n=1 Tax=Kwoniella shandongensis TaxID=1734106 RepID=A0A5M6CCZ6_9TREE|nr:uncharacterized protein CI109_000166 [Kwoniella shandongensis]KAA5531325.1 hypothetical protein CI109_000166 [Kwoniella shandongensis]